MRKPGGQGVQREEGTKRYHLVEIKVLGQTFTVKSDAEENHIREVARYVNEKIEEILAKTRTVSSLNVAILAALNIADDLLKEKERRKSMLDAIEAQSRELVERIEMKIGGKEAEKISIVD